MYAIKKHQSVFDDTTTRPKGKNTIAEIIL
jgi:hypothetical protein